MSYSDVMARLYEKGSIAKMTPIIAEGVAYHQIGESCHLTINSILKRELQDNPNLPDGFNYEGYRVASPEEFIKWQMESTSKTRSIDISRSDYYLVFFKFSVMDDTDGTLSTIEKPLLVMYIDKGNKLTIQGSQRLISAVWHQPGLGVSNNGFFVHFPYSKRIKFELTAFTIRVHGDEERVYLPYSNQLKSRQRTSKTNLPLVPYWLFCKYGFAGAIKHYLNVDVKVLHYRDIANGAIDRNDYTIVESTSSGKMRDPMRICIPRENLTTNLIERTAKEKELLTFVASLLYANRYQSNRLPIGNLECESDWERVLGYSIEPPKGNYEAHEREMFKEIGKHLTIEFPRYYCDKFHREMLMTGVDDLENTYDFLYHVIREIPKMMNKPRSEMSSIYGKTLKTIEYLFTGKDGLAIAINNVRWGLTTLADKAYEATGRRVVKRSSVTAVVHKNFKVNKLTNIRSGHGEVTQFSSASENAIFSMSSNAIDQVDATENFKRKGGTSINLDDPSLHRHISKLEGGNYGAVTKPDPFGLRNLNSYMTLGPGYTLIPNPKYLYITQPAQIDLASRGRLR